MKLPAQLTWLNLFPRGMSLSCAADVPAPLRDAVDRVDRTVTNSPSDNGAVRIGGTPRRGDAGFVAVNTKISDAELRAEGFNYIRRFAVLPNWDSARWYVPLDRPAITSGGFSLYSPARLSAKLKVAAARIAAYSHLPVWYKDSITIAQAAPPPIEQKLAELFPGREFRLGLSSGAPEPARNRKVSIAVIGMDGRIIGFGKIAGSELSHRLMQDESRALPELEKRLVRSPSLMFAGEIDGKFVTLQRPLSGRPVQPNLCGAKRKLLESLRSGRIGLASETNLVATLGSRLAALPSPHPELSEALQDVLPILCETRVPSTIIHGDFAPWNLRTEHGKVCAFDWEYAELDGLPLFDEFHYQLQVGYLLNDWSLDRAIALAAQMQRENDLHLSPAAVRAIQVVYLIDNLCRLFAEGYDDKENDMVGWYCQLLQRLGHAAQREMTAA